MSGLNCRRKDWAMGSAGAGPPVPTSGLRTAAATEPGGWRSSPPHSRSLGAGAAQERPFCVGSSVPLRHGSHSLCGSERRSGRRAGVRGCLGREGPSASVPSSPSLARQGPGPPPGGPCARGRGTVGPPPWSGAHPSRPGPVSEDGAAESSSSPAGDPSPAQPPRGCLAFRPLSDDLRSGSFVSPRETVC